jgi:cell division septation protein DedD
MTDRENEKELVLGNSQLISLFFVVVALCGVFFALGYMIGRNSGHPVVANLDGSAATATTPAPATTEPSRETPPSDVPSAASSSAPSSALSSTQPAPAPDAAQAIQTQPARSLPAPVPGSSKEPAAAERTQTKPAPAAAAAATATSEIQPTEPGATYLQVAALRHDDAAKLVRTLREQDLPAHLAESPKPEIFRVLVGPYHQTAQVADAKARLKTLGFANAFVQK